MDDKALKEFTSRFEIIKSKGHIRSNRKGNTGVGKTFEDYMGIKENNLDTPDLGDIEIKCQRANASSKITLFTKAPTMPIGANAFLKDNFGTPDSHYPDLKVLHTSIFADRWNTHASGYGFKLHCNDSSRKMYLLIKKLETGEIVSDEVYWTYEVFQKIIDTKLQRLAIVDAETITLDGREFFHFKKCILYSDMILEDLIGLIMDGKLMFDVRIGVYKSGTNKGKPHDHGSGFRVSKSDLQELYSNMIEI